MVIIDTKKNIAHECVSKSEAARIIGVDRSTIRRWEVSSDTQQFNHFIVYFTTVRHRQQKGVMVAENWRPPHYRRQ